MERAGIDIDCKVVGGRLQASSSAWITEGACKVMRRLSNGYEVDGEW